VSLHGPRHWEPTEVTRYSPPPQVMLPDWVVLGVRTDDGVIVIASTEMTQAELRYEVDLEHDFRSVTARAVPNRDTQRYHLTTTMKRFVMVMGATYAEAMTNLFGMWSPDDDQRALPR
jgi:hypothetical protein